jgi:hypothetical protein
MIALSVSTDTENRLFALPSNTLTLSEESHDTEDPERAVLVDTDAENTLSTREGSPFSEGNGSISL